MVKLGDWVVFCDICGQRHWASQSVKLPTYSGRGNLIVCKKDADKIDFGLVPFTPRKEKPVDFVRVNHINTDISSPYVDLEAMAYSFFLSSSQDNIILSPSQNLDEGLTVLEPF